MSEAEIWAQAAAQALSGWARTRCPARSASSLTSSLAARPSADPGPSLRRRRPSSAGRRTQDYELQKMQDNIEELNAAIDIARRSSTRAQARASAAEIAWQAALQRAQLADAALEAFDNDFFTPETWQQDGRRDARHRARAISTARIRIAKLMERAYNFENDTEPEDHQERLRLRGRDSALRPRHQAARRRQSAPVDIESFTYEAITSKTRKSSRIKDVISIAANFPRSSRSSAAPACSRSRPISTSSIGCIPASTGNASKPSRSRSSACCRTTRARTGTALRRRRHRLSHDRTAPPGKRVHQIDTMALSEFTLRDDTFLYRCRNRCARAVPGLSASARRGRCICRSAATISIFAASSMCKLDPLLHGEVRRRAAHDRAGAAAPAGRARAAAQLRSALRFPRAWYGFYQSGKRDVHARSSRGCPSTSRTSSVEAIHSGW